MRQLRVVCLLVCIGCASAPIRPADEAALAAADAQVLAGCYDCLLEARDTYQRVGVGRARPLVVTRLFQTELLLALREKELALPSSGAEARARALVSELEPGLDATRVLTLADLMPLEQNGAPRRLLSERRRDTTRTGALRTLGDDVAWLPASGLAEPVWQYLALSAFCAYSRQARLTYPPLAPVTGLRDPATGVAPLIAYRAATCQSNHANDVDPVVAAVPRFVEALYFKARLSVATVQRRGNVTETREAIDAAYARFPTSPAVVYLNGRFNQLIGDCKAGLRYYDETLALQPLHEDALLGRTMCLSFLKAHVEAIATAARMVELRTDNRAEALYWSAWNRHVLKELDLARADIDAAKALQSNARFFTLAGMIEHDQDDLDPAERDLFSALAFGEGNCIADWYLGLVLMKKERWADTAGAFENAMTCYDKAVKESEDGLAAIRANENLDPEFRQRQVAGFEAAIKEDRSQYHAAAFNAANHHARAGSIEKARPLLDIAAVDPALAGYVRQLREIIKR
jgi:tetratricopeptide (TPR) repeat protein